MPEPSVSIREFIEREAALLDDARYEEWVELFAPGAVYWAPVSPDQRTPTEGVSHFNDDLQLLMARTHRLANPRIYSAEPPPRTLHVVSSVRLEKEEGQTIHVTSSQMMAEYRARGRFEDDQRLFAARVRHTLLRDGEGWKILLKRIDLINASGSFNAILAPL